MTHISSHIPSTAILSALLICGVAKANEQSTLMATLSPMGKVAYEDCRGTQKNYYSCGCLAEKVDERVATKQESLLAENNTKMEHQIRALEQAKAITSTRYSDEEKERLIKFRKQEIERLKQRELWIKNRDSWSQEQRKTMAREIKQELFEASVCRRPEGLREKEDGTVAAQAVAQEDDTFCGSTGAMIVSADSIPEEGIRNEAYAYAAGDKGAPAVIEAHGLDLNQSARDSELNATVTRFGSAAVLSSAAEANRLLPDLDCSRFNVIPLD